jgi:hypothetical protein
MGTARRAARGMAGKRHITSIAQVLTLDDRVLTDCYVLGIGFSGLTAVAERPVPPATAVFVDLAYVNEAGKLEGETLKARVERCEPRTGSHLLNMRFFADLRERPRSRLARHLRRELDQRARTAQHPPGRETGDEML